MNTYYKVKLNPHPLIIKVKDEIEEIIFGLNKYISVKKAEQIVRQLNNGEQIDFNNLNK
jgi:hypothetical protein